MIRRAAALLVGALALAGCATPSDSDDSRGGGAWTELPAPPLPPRTGAATAWTGTEALFLGGHTGPPCLDVGGAADCNVPPGAQDGAAFDPEAGTWRRTAEAPVAIPADVPTALGGDSVYLAVERHLVSYDASDDAWTVHPVVDGMPEHGGLAVFEDRVVVTTSERRAGEPSGHVYDPATQSWSVLPEDPLGPAFDRLLTATPAGLVLTGHDLVPNPNAEQPSVVRAAVLDPTSSEWTLLEDSDQLGGWRWTWTGSRMVDPTLGSADGGEDGNFGRAIPMGGVLDPATGTWDRLPGAPELTDDDGWGVEALGGPLSAVHGWVYDDRAESWTLLPSPSGAPPTPGSAVWAGERLVVLGGVDPSRGMTLDALSEEVWMWTPAGSAEAAPGDGMAGVWALREGRFAGDRLRIPDRTRATIEFGAGGRVGGTAFCNGFGGTYRLDGAALVLEDIAHTLVGWQGDIAAAEEAYLGVLLAPGLSARPDEAQLVLASDAGELRFFRLPPVPEADVVGTRWVLETVTQEGTASAAVGEPAGLDLGEDGTATFSTGCQTMTGTWTTQGDSVVLAGHEYDPTGCEAAVAQQDSLVTQLLSGGFQVTVDGDLLTVTDVDVRGAEALALAYRASR